MNGSTTCRCSSWRDGPAIWIVAVLLAFIAGLLAAGGGFGLTAQAQAQSGPLVGARGVYSFSGQIGSNRYGVFMLDIEQGTLWCYELEPSATGSKLKLVAARSWVYDRYLRDFNCAEPDFRKVQQLVAQQRDEIERPAGDGARPESEADKPRSPD